jgi:SAM-dependent methyltransferase
MAEAKLYKMNRIHHWYCRSSAWKRRVDEELLPWALDGTATEGPALEIGPGPGLTTDYLRTKVQSLTALERDPVLAEKLHERLRGTNVRAIEGDATAMPLENGVFRTLFCITMLHHVPTASSQERVIAEALRVLVPAGLFIGTNSRMSFRRKVFHWFDTMVIVEPETFPARLRGVGFADAQIELAAGAFRFCAARQ